MCSHQSSLRGAGLPRAAASLLCIAVIVGGCSLPGGGSSGWKRPARAAVASSVKDVRRLDTGAHTESAHTRVAERIDARADRLEDIDVEGHERASVERCVESLRRLSDLLRDESLLPPAHGSAEASSPLLVRFAGSRTVRQLDACAVSAGMKKVSAQAAQ